MGVSGGHGQAPAFRVARCQTRSGVDIRLGPVGSRQVSSGLVGARRGPVWVRILVVHPHGSIESSVRAHQVPSEHIGHIGQSSVRSKNIEFGPKWVENRRFGPKQRPNESYRLSGPIWTTPEAKNDQKIDFLRKTCPGGPRRTSAAPLTPIGAGRGLRILQWGSCHNSHEGSTSARRPRPLIARFCSPLAAF